MSFDRNRLPEPTAYFEFLGLVLKGAPRSKWKTTECRFHGGSDSMRVNTENGAWRCMACGEHGGDVLAFEQRVTGADFVTAARALGAWVEDGKTPAQQQKPRAFSARDGLEVLAQETNLVVIALAAAAHGTPLSEADKARLLEAAGRIAAIAREYQQ